MKKLLKRVKWHENAKLAAKNATYGIVWTAIGTAIVFVFDGIIDIIFRGDPD